MSDDDILPCMIGSDTGGCKHCRRPAT